jgi:hypothetical protein
MTKKLGIVERKRWSLLGSGMINKFPWQQIRSYKGGGGLYWTAVNSNVSTVCEEVFLVVRPEVV